MPTLVDRTGKRYGAWTVLRRSDIRKPGRSTFWECRCDCGTESTVAGGNLGSGLSTNCGCLRTPTTIALEPGAQFAGWTVLKLGPRGKCGDQAMWWCRCVCGKERLVRSGALRRRQSLSCGCTRTYDHNTFPVGDVREYHWRWTTYAGKAEIRNLEFALTLEEFAAMTKLDCTYCGAPPALKVRKHRVRAASALMNGIDRVDNSKGYVLSNCVPCCTWCNEMKRHRDAEDFVAHAKRIAEHMKQT